MTTAWPGLATVDRARHAEQLAFHGVQRGARGSRTEHELARGQPAQLDGLPVGAVHHDAQRGSALDTVPKCCLATLDSGAIPCGVGFVASASKAGSSPVAPTLFTLVTTFCAVGMALSRER